MSVTFSKPNRNSAEKIEHETINTDYTNWTYEIQYLVRYAKTQRFYCFDLDLTEAIKLRDDLNKFIEQSTKTLNDKVR